MDTINIGLLGFGTVGKGVADILKTNSNEITTRSESKIIIKKALVQNLEKERPYNDSIDFTVNPDDVLNNPEIDIVVEAMGGIEPAKSYILAALQNKKNVVTANKDLLALHGTELFEAAQKNKRDLLFEASVGGGIPIISVIRQSLTANKMTSVIGIINGTTNYILTNMTEQGRDFSEVLAEAQEMGFAEADPTSDVEGLDAARKLAILSTLAFNSNISFQDVFAEGISAVTPQDIQYAEELGCVIKLLAIAKNQEDGIEVRVHPALLPKSHPLANIRGVYNAVYIVGNAVEDTMYYGKGAGSLPTGSAVVSDIIQVIRNMKANSTGMLGSAYFNNSPIKASDNFRTGYYIRLKVKDEPRVFATLALFFAEAGISFASIIQKPRRNNNAEIVLVTHPCQEKQLRQALDSLNSYSKLDKVYNVIRMEMNGF